MTIVSLGSISLVRLNTNSMMAKYNSKSSC